MVINVREQLRQTTGSGCRRPGGGARPVVALSKEKEGDRSGETMPISVQQKTTVVRKK